MGACWRLGGVCGWTKKWKKKSRAGGRTPDLKGASRKCYPLHHAVTLSPGMFCYHNIWLGPFYRENVHVNAVPSPLPLEKCKKTILSPWHSSKVYLSNYIGCRFSASTSFSVNVIVIIIVINIIINHHHHHQSSSSSSIIIIIINIKRNLKCHVRAKPVKVAGTVP